ncbi:MAG: DeoR family transcriptional regulator [bacterium]|nr:DeoR family transcriptional regulator [bacterium]
MQAEIRKKAQEISYIATKLAELSTRQEIANKVEVACLNLIEKIYGQEYLSALEKTEVLEGLIAFSVNTGQTSIEYGEELINRTASLKDLLIEGYTNKEESRKLEAKLAMLPEPHKRGNPSTSLTSTKLSINRASRQSGNKNTHKLPYDNQNSSLPASGGPKAQQRQEKIVSLLKERGKLQLKDIINAFPKTSERTIRYDLTALCDSKKLIREGNGGPANFYMLPSAIMISSLEPQIQPKSELGPSKVSYPAPLPENAPIYDENTQETAARSDYVAGRASPSSEAATGGSNFAKNELNEAFQA